MKIKQYNSHEAKINPDGSFSIYFGLKNYREIKILPWDQGCHILVKREQGWEYYDGSLDFILMRTGPSVVPDATLIPFVKIIPVDIKLKLKKFQLHQARMLQLIASNSSARELFECNPVLLWLLICWGYSNDIHMVDIKTILMKKQVNILKIMFPQATNKYVKLVSRIELYSYDERMVAPIYKIMACLDKTPVLGHCQTISNDILGVLMFFDKEKNVNFKLIIAMLKYYQSNGTVKYYEIISIYKDTLLMHSDIHGETTLPNFTQQNFLIKDVIKYHDALIMEHFEFQFNKNEHAELQMFPAPFILGNENIVHIKNYKELLEEGREMEHCIASHLDDIMTSQSQIYKVISPQRATLELVKKNGELMIQQLKLKSNKEPFKETYSAVKEWLNNLTDK